MEAPGVELAVFPTSAHDFGNPDFVAVCHSRHGAKGWHVRSGVGTIDVLEAAVPAKAVCHLVVVPV